MKKAAFSIPTIYTFVTPIRSVAFSNHCVWVEQAKKDLVESNECAIYYEPYPNRVYPYTMDAIFVEILADRQKYKVSGFAVIPDEERGEIRINECHTNFTDAKQAASEWLLSAREFIK